MTDTAYEALAHACRDDTTLVDTVAELANDLSEAAEEARQPGHEHVCRALDDLAEWIGSIPKPIPGARLLWQNNCMVFEECSIWWHSSQTEIGYLSLDKRRQIVSTLLTAEGDRGLSFGRRFLVNWDDAGWWICRASLTDRNRFTPWND
jgi:hypothetical protein